MKSSRRSWILGLSAAALLVAALIFAASVSRIHDRVFAHITGVRSQAATATLARHLLAGRYRFYDVAPAMVWNNGQHLDPAHLTIDFLSSIVLSSDSPSLLLFARFDIYGHAIPPQFDISIDGGPIKTVVWRTVLMPQSLSLGSAGEHTIVIWADPLYYQEVGSSFTVQQNVITGFAVPANYRIRVEQEPRHRQVLVTVTDSIGQGARTPDPVRDAWTARLASSGRWPGTVMNRGYVGAHLADYCSSKASCVTYAANLDRDFPNAAAYYFALGTNDFGVPAKCVPPGAFAENFSSLLEELHALNPRAALYLQTPLHRADEGRPNRCGNTLPEFRDAELRMAPTMPWLTLIDGFSRPFPQNTPGGTGYADGVHLTAQGQEQVFNAVVQSLHLGS
jgi:hypothetical protein